MSRALNPLTTSNAYAISAKVRAIGPRVENVLQVGGSGSPFGMTPCVVLNPLSPQTSDGIRIDPPPSDPVARLSMPDAMAAAVPPDDPPAVRSRAHGLRLGPKTTLSVSAVKPCAGVFVLPNTTAPADRYRETWIESRVAGGSSRSPGRC